MFNANLKHMIHIVMQSINFDGRISYNSFKPDFIKRQIKKRDTSLPNILMGFKGFERDAELLSQVPMLPYLFKGHPHHLYQQPRP